MTDQAWGLIALCGGMLLVLVVASIFSQSYSLNRIKSKTVGDGQHGTARWATPQEIRDAYLQVPFTPQLWRKGQNLPKAQGLVVGSLVQRKKTIALMKHGVIIINTSRGSIVDEAALVRALQEEKIAGAGLDVLEQEPLDPENPLIAMDNVLTAPHIGGATKEAASRSSVACAQAIDDFFSGRAPQFVVPELRDLLNQ